MYKIKAADGKCNIVGNFLKEYRLRRNMSLRDMASMLQNHDLDWDKNAVDRTERGIRAVIDIEIVKLSNIIGISSDELLGIK